MPQYQFRCDSCGNSYMVAHRSSVPPCPTCGTHPRRVWAFTHSNSMPEHFNNAVGDFVTNKQQFYDGLKRQSEEHTIRTGVEHDYQPIDPSDMKDQSAHGVTDEGLDATHRALYMP